MEFYLQIPFLVLLFIRHADCLMRNVNVVFHSHSTFPMRINLLRRLLIMILLLSNSAIGRQRDYLNSMLSEIISS